MLTTHLIMKYLAAYFFIADKIIKFIDSIFNFHIMDLHRDKVICIVSVDICFKLYTFRVDL